MNAIMLLLATLFVGPHETYKTVQAAIDACGGKSASATVDAARSGGGTLASASVIVIRDGFYPAPVRVEKSQKHITLKAEHPGRATLWSDASVYDYEKKGRPFAAAMEIYGTDFTAEGLRFVNTASREPIALGKKSAGQAPALVVSGDRATFRDCVISGHQAVLKLYSKNGAAEPNRYYFANCTLEGTVDIVYGGGRALFDHCTIRALRGGYIAFPSTDQANPFGFVFSHCTVEAAPGMNVLLGRPWRPYGRAVFVDCDLAEGVSPKGWRTNGKPGEDGYGTAWFGVFNATGKGAENAQYPSWTHTKPEDWQALLAANNCADVYDILKGRDGWGPRLGRARTPSAPPTESACGGHGVTALPSLETLTTNGFDVAYADGHLRVTSLAGGEFRFVNTPGLVSPAFRLQEGVTAFDAKRGVTYDFGRP